MVEIVWASLAASISLFLYTFLSIMSEKIKINFKKSEKNPSNSQKFPSSLEVGFFHRIVCISLYNTNPNLENN